MRYKTGGFGKGSYGDIRSYHTPVTINTFADYMSKELKCDMRLNNIILYKATCGDKSDVVKGIKGFGPKAFDRFMKHLDGEGVDFKDLVDPDNVEELLRKEVDYLGKDKLDEALYALSLVRRKPVTVTDNKPIKNDSREKREKAYMKYKMKSLID
jgi:5'-3' exonuclease